MERILAILSEETEYSQELAAFLANRHDFIFRPVVFTCTEAYSDYVRSHKVDMLLCDESLTEELDSEAVADTVCVLTQTTYVAERQQYPGIFKYQSSETVMREIIRVYAGKENGISAVRRSYGSRTASEMICVCSPIGGSFKSTFALALAKYYSGRGKTLFLSFDPFFSFPGTSKSPMERNLTDILYYLQTSACDPFSFIPKITKKTGNLEYIEGAAHWFDVAEMKPNHISRLIEAAEKSDRYGTIIIDLCADSVAGVELLMAAARIYAPGKGGITEQARFDEWKRQIGFIGHMEILDKIREIEVPYDENLRGELVFEKLLTGPVGHMIDEMEGRSDY